MRAIDPAFSFSGLVNWIHDDVILGRYAPGVIIGLSGTDSLVVFLAAYEAFKRAGKANRVYGVHFAPSEDFLYDHPEAEAHTWFGKEVIPWVKERCPEARVEINTDIDWRMDGVRWGMLGEMGAVSYEHGRKMREHKDRYWLMGTRNRTEDLLYTYSNASLACGIQPLVHLWKSEVLSISKYLGVPQIAIEKSCDVDCICGRQRLPAQHIREVDQLLAARLGYTARDANMDVQLMAQLEDWIRKQINRSSYKRNIPYTPMSMPLTVPPAVFAFESGTLNLRTFDHRLHLYVAWCYLSSMPFAEAVERYARHLKHLLDNAGVARKFNMEVTEAYFHKLDAAMAQYPGANFDELMLKAGQSLATTQ